VLASAAAQRLQSYRAAQVVEIVLRKVLYRPRHVLFIAVTEPKG
jgi:hypothetical protein